MTIEEFSKYWDYYLILEKEFLQLEHYIAIDEINFNTFSNVYNRQMQSVCSEFDVACKKYCAILDKTKNSSKINEYAEIILKKDNNVINTILNVKNTNLKITPLKDLGNYIGQNSQSEIMNWWYIYNKVKHQRTDTDKNEVNKDGSEKSSKKKLPKEFEDIEYYKLANQKNVLYGLGGLYIINRYIYRELSKAISKKIDEPHIKSKLFTIEGESSKIITINEAEGIYMEIEDSMDMSEWKDYFSK